LGRLTDCVDHLICPLENYIDDSCEPWGSICAKNQTSFKCGDKEYSWKCPLSSMVNEVIESRQDEFKYYWPKRILGLLNCSLLNFNLSPKGFFFDISFGYDSSMDLQTIFDELTDAIMDDISIKRDRINIKTLNDVKRNTGNTSLARVNIIDLHSGIPKMLSSWILMLWFLILLFLL